MATEEQLAFLLVIAFALMFTSRRLSFLLFVLIASVLFGLQGMGAALLLHIIVEFWDTTRAVFREGGSSDVL